ncbi:Histidine kinase-, DNA gyrase B-, and HSP90-like ATPase [Geodermatophilus saharensis]|uniref:histidine kinase n=1 Tax=Geodermatophilus saharensis TaxID=1137994 RepID=A0A239HAN9_9ACTN|nr:histidine kinase [Geodermatophilus saharensis]SNS78437.1 Histidine kinase-, DNA gyrase B-, and HSP90-like ATPase [Geodermatophilus saharensis]
MYRNRRGSRVALPAARLLAVCAVAATAAALALPVAAGGDWLPRLFRTPEPVAGPSFAVAGALLAGLPQARRLGWLLLAVGCSASAYVLATSWWAAAGQAGPAGWVRSWVWVPALLLVTTVLPQVVPSGRPLPGWWRVPHAAALALTALTTAALALPLGIGDPFGVPAFPVLLGALVAAGVASLVVRVRRADGVQRRQLAWAGYGVVAATAATFLAPWWGVSLAVLLVPAGLAVAAFRYRLYDIDVLVNRTVVGGVLLGLTALVYAAVVGWAGALLGDRRGWAPFLAAFAVALAFSPARLRVQRLVDRLLYGDRGDPYTLLTRVDAALGAAASPRQALRDGAAAVASGLRLRGAAVEVPLPGGAVVREEAGRVPADARRVPLALHGEPVGELLVAPRAAAAGLEPADDRVLADLAGRLAAAAYAVRLSGDLAESRERLVTAREEERRRLRRDLHDGLGPQLSAVVMTLDTAGSALRRDDPARAAALVAAAGTQAADAVADVRRLVHGLRPPTLDDLGLLGALRAGAAPLAERGPRVTVTGEGDLTGLPAAVEVAALRIAQEALHNAVRHAGARAVAIGVTAGADTVEVEVSDDGRGLPGRPVPGVGLSSMRERAAELGGSCTVGPGDPTGTRVHAVLPRHPHD